MNIKHKVQNSVRSLFPIVVFAMLALLSGCSSAAPVAETNKLTARLSENGAALQKIVVSAGATERTRAAAQTLADYLGRISGAKFEIATGDGSTGIAVGLASDFPTLQLQRQFAPADPLRREEYVLRSGAQGVLLVGATEQAVEDAVWDLLDRLGYRQFFPGETWEVIPANPSISMAVDVLGKPDFYTRRIWYGHGLWDYNEKPYADWCARNRAVPGFRLATSHSYQAIIRQNAETFKAHPEYLALVDGERKGSKFCISNPGLRKLVVEEYALAYFRDNPDSDCVSLEPSDGGDWCECDKCAALGSVTDRVVLLANEAAEAISKAYPGKCVGLLAYNLHSPPPTIRVHPNVIVKVQTAFLRGGYTFDQLVEGWQKQGARIGVGDYYSVFQSDMSRPASQKGSDLYTIKTSIPKFHQQGARFFMSESSDLWGAIGLGHYIAARLAWDTSQAQNFDALVDDFLSKSFGPAKQPMDGFFHLIYLFNKDDSRPMIRADMLARMYRFLAEAKKLAGDDAKINARLNDLLLFTRYEELFQNYENASGAARQKSVEDIIRHSYQIRETMMVHSKPIFMRLADKASGVTEPTKERVAVEKKFSNEELNQILAEGVANTKVIEVGFKPVSFSHDLVPATPLQLPDVKRGDFNGTAPMGRQKFLTWMDAPGELRLSISGGHIVHYRNIASNVQTRLYAEANPMVGEEVAYDESVKPDGVLREVVLKTPFEGLHQLDVIPPSNRAKVDTVNESTPLTMESSMDAGNALSGAWSLYFYVPKGTKIVGGFASTRTGALLDGSGKEQLAFSKIETPGYFKVDVPEGQDGKLWKFNQCTGKRLLLTVPPFLARSGKELLLPQEVVKADAKQ